MEGNGNKVEGEESNEYLIDDDGRSKESVVEVMNQNGGASGTIFISDDIQLGEFSLMDSNLDENTFSSSPLASGGGVVPLPPGQKEAKHPAAAHSKGARKDAKTFHNGTVSALRGRDSGNDSEEDTDQYMPSKEQLMVELERAKSREREMAHAAEIASLRQQLEVSHLKEQLANMNKQEGLHVQAA